jgi:ribosomal protein S21
MRSGDAVARPGEGEQRRLDRERAAAAPPKTSTDAEKRLAAIRASKTFWDANDPKRPALMREYNALLAGMEETTQPEIREQMSTAEKRGEFGVEVKHAGGKQAEEKWNETREGDFYDIAHAWGLEAPLVRDVVARLRPGRRGCRLRTHPRRRTRPARREVRQVRPRVEGPGEGAARVARLLVREVVKPANVVVEVRDGNVEFALHLLRKGVQDSGLTSYFRRLKFGMPRTRNEKRKAKSFLALRRRLRARRKASRRRAAMGGGLRLAA